MNAYDKARLQRLISDEHGENYHKNVPLDGFTITLDDSFISFSFKKIEEVTVVVISYIYVTSKNDFINLMGFCIKMWAGYGAKMIYYKEHKRKSNITKFLKYIDFDITPVKKTKWKHKWTSSNGYKEEDCIEACTKYTNANTKTTKAQAKSNKKK